MEASESFTPPETITVFFCACGAPPIIDPRYDEFVAPKCRSHPYPARAMGPPMERFTYRVENTPS